MYKITIEKIEKQKVLKEGKWEVIDKVPFTEKDLIDAYNKDSYAGELKEVRGYLKDREVDQEVTTKVLEQTVDDIDLVSVIKAINGIGDIK